jgi:cytidine deaminase
VAKKNFSELLKKAKKVAIKRELEKYSTTGEVGSALLTDKGNIYIGVSIDSPCGIGFCAEQGAIAAMVTNGEFIIKKIVAITSDGRIIPPCGKCREMIYEMNSKNYNAEIMFTEGKIKRLKELLPNTWQEKF